MIAPLAETRRVLELALDGKLGAEIAEPATLGKYEAAAIQRLRVEGCLDGVTITDRGRRVLELIGVQRRP